MPKVTISQIAKEAGVSKTAVSFAFNDPSQLASGTVRHIREIAERLGYTPDPIARSMTTRRTNALGLLLPQDIATALANPFYTQFIRGVGKVCGRAGLTLMLVPPLWGSVMKAIPHAAVDGFIVVGLEVDRGEVQLMRRRHVPFVMVDSQAPDDLPSVNVDDRSGARAVMAHVLAQGHRRIAIMCIESGKAGHVDEYTGTLAERLTGYCEALAEVGLSLDSPGVQLVEAPSSWEGGQAAFEQLWDAGHRPTAIVAMSDIIAIGAMDTARAHQIRLPQELSVAGFDDLPDARLTRPSLTTVRQPVEEKGRLAADVLVDALAESGATTHHLLPTELVIRQSVVAPRVS
jgi:DNA-binding LacI/PurR family transcriptional regulator